MKSKQKIFSLYDCKNRHIHTWEKFWKIQKCLKEKKAACSLPTSINYLILMWFFRLFSSVDLHISKIIEITMCMCLSWLFVVILWHLLNLLLKTWFLMTNLLLYECTIIYFITSLDLDRLFSSFPYNKTGKTESRQPHSAVNIFLHVCLSKEIHFNGIFWCMRNALLCMPKAFKATVRARYTKMSSWKWMCFEWFFIFKKIVLFTERFIHPGSFK